MTSPSKTKAAVQESVAQILARAANSRGITNEEILPRIETTIEKYLCVGGAQPSTQAIGEFAKALNADDLCLIFACERGDEDAWSELVSRFDSTVKSAARKFASSNEDAEDLASSIWAELYGLKKTSDGKARGKLGYYSGRGSLAGWLRAVVSQLAIDQFRKESRFVQIEETREFENLAQASALKTDNENVLHTIENPEENFMSKETSRDVSLALMQSIEELPDEDRLILKMYYFDEVKLKDIGSALGFHEATASRKLMRIQTEIRKSVVKILTQKNGWRPDEIDRQLNEVAAKLDLNFDKLVAAFAVAVLTQDWVAEFVLRSGS